MFALLSERICPLLVVSCPTVIVLVVVLPFVVTSSKVTEIAPEEILVNCEPSPMKLAAVTSPVTIASPSSSKEPVKLSLPRAPGHRQF